MSIMFFLLMWILLSFPAACMSGYYIKKCNRFCVVIGKVERSNVDID